MNWNRCRINRHRCTSGSKPFFKRTSLLCTRIWKQQTNQSVSTACRPDRHHWQNKRDRQKDQRESEPASRPRCQLIKTGAPTLIAEWKYNDMNVINYSTAPSCFWQLFRPGPMAFINNSPMKGSATTITKNVFPLVTNLIPQDGWSDHVKIMLKTSKKTCYVIHLNF